MMFFSVLLLLAIVFDIFYIQFYNLMFSGLNLENSVQKQNRCIL